MKFYVKRETEVKKILRKSLMYLSDRRKIIFLTVSEPKEHQSHCRLSET